MNRDRAGIYAVVLTIIIWALYTLMTGCSGQKIMDRLEKNPYINERADAKLYNLGNQELALEMAVFTENADRVFFFYECSAADGPYDYVGNGSPDEHGQVIDRVAFYCPSVLIVTVRAMKYQDKFDKKYEVRWKIDVSQYNED